MKRRVVLWLLVASVLVPAWSESSGSAKLFGVMVNDQIVQLDTKTGKILKSLSFKTDPNYEEGLTYDGKKFFYINGRGADKIVEFDGALEKQLTTLPVELPPRIDGLAVNGTKIFALDFVNNKILKYNQATGKVEGSLTLSFPAIGDITFGGKRKTLFVSSFELSSLSKNKIYEIDPETAKVIHSFDCDYSVFAMAYSQSLNILFVSTGSFMQKQTEALDPDTGKVLYSFPGAFSALAADSIIQ